MNPENPEERLARRQETNLGDLEADAMYWHYNFEKDADCDVAIINGGGLRADMPKGTISYNSVKTVNPFGNVICLMSITDLGSSVTKWSSFALT